MKLTAVFMLAMVLTVNAEGVSQEITYSGKNVPLQKVFAVIKQQTGYVTMTSVELFASAKPVTVDVQQMPLNNFLQLILQHQLITFSLDDKNIILTKKNNSTDDLNRRWDEPHFSAADNLPITGIIRDADGRPLPGVNIVIKGTKRGTISGADGTFQLNANIGDRLIFSSIGYTDVEITISNTKPISVNMIVNTSELDEVIVNKGYYSEKKRLSTGNVGTLTAAEIAKQPISDPLMALTGKIPGLLVTQISGVPGASISVSLRGRNSIKNGVDPLYIVDGVPFNSKYSGQIENAAVNLSPFMSIRPDDIESIDVLKDADATAIYGSRGANGVILITTKKGKKGKTNFNANIYSGIGQIANRLKLMNTQQYLEMRNEGLKNDGLTPQFYEYDINGEWDTTRYTDWQDVMIGQTAHFTNANASLSGGNENTQFLLGASYRKETTVYPGDYSNQTGSGNLNVRHTSDNKRFTADITVNYSSYKNRLPLNDFSTYIYIAPDAPALYNDDGSLNWQNSTWTNPFASLKRSSTTISNNLITNLMATYKILEGLQIRSSFGYNITDFKGTALYPYSAMDPSFPDPEIYRAHNRLAGENKSWIIEPQLNYVKKMKDHHIEALIGTTFQSNNQESLSQSASGFSSDAIIENFNAGTQITNGSSFYSEYRYTALFGRLSYNYKQKYILNLTGRRDGSSRFGPENRFGNFGAIGAAWILSQENFMHKHLSVISFAKIRGSIGKTGNDQFEDYAYLSTYNPIAGSYSGISGLRPTNLSNPFYGWETINKIEGGLDLGFFRDRIQLNVSYYRNRTSDQLVGYSLPYSSGFTTVVANLPAVIQNKGLEIEVSTVNIKKDNLYWTTSANISFPRNKLVSFPNIEATGYAQRYAVGEPLSIVYYYIYKGIDPDSGIYSFEDLNKDGSITQKLDRTPIFYGNRFYGGLSNALSYRGFDLDFTFQFVDQAGYLNKIYNPPGGFDANQLTDVLDRWRSPEQPGKFQRYTSEYIDVYSAGDRYLQSDVTIVNASFIRLRNIMLGWNVPKSLLRNLGIQNLKVYMQGQNLLTITGFEGFDPENQRAYGAGGGGGAALPPLRLITGGLQITL